MFDRKFLDFILVVEYLIRIAVYLILWRLTILLFCGEKSWLFLTYRSSSLLSLGEVVGSSSLLFLFVGLPLLKSRLPACCSSVLARPLNANELFSSMSRLLLTKLKPVSTALTIENFMLEDYRILLVT